MRGEIVCLGLWSLVFGLCFCLMLKGKSAKGVNGSRRKGGLRFRAYVQSVRV